jgi:hypothetical protein
LTTLHICGSGRHGRLTDDLRYDATVYHSRLGILGGQLSIRSLLASITSVSKRVFHSFVHNPVEKRLNVTGRLRIKKVIPSLH